MPVAPAAIQSLRQALSSSSLIEAPLQQQWWDEAGFAPIVCSNGFTFDDEMASASMNDTERIWFKIVFRRPSKAKRAQAGHLSTPDLGLSLHRPLMRNTASQRILALCHRSVSCSSVSIGMCYDFMCIHIDVIRVYIDLNSTYAARVLSTLHTCRVLEMGVTCSCFFLIRA